MEFQTHVGLRTLVQLLCNRALEWKKNNVQWCGVYLSVKNYSAKISNLKRTRASQLQTRDSPHPVSPTVNISLHWLHFSPSLCVCVCVSLSMVWFGNKRGKSLLLIKTMGAVSAGRLGKQPSKKGWKLENKSSFVGNLCLPGTLLTALQTSPL